MDAEQRHFPKAAGVLFGLGLGGYFDGIVLRQLLQWHHMLSSWYPVNTIENLELNTLWDGIFHSTTYLFVVAGLFVLWRSARRRHLFWSSKPLAGTVGLDSSTRPKASSIITCSAFITSTRRSRAKAGSIGTSPSRSRVLLCSRPVAAAATG